MVLRAAGRGRRTLVLVMAGVLLAFAIALPAAAEAATLTVDSPSDEADLAPGGGCATAAGKCTLRAAIEEANAAVGGGDEIVFDEDVFDGGSAGTITLEGNLPPLVKQAVIKGGSCMTDAAVEGPCVAVDGTDSGPVFEIKADHAKVEGIDIFSASSGISLEGAQGFEVRGNWFGLRLDGHAESAGVAFGVQVGPGSADGQIGGKEPKDGNLFANGYDGLEIIGGSRISILGNRFGFGPGGSLSEAFGTSKAITIVSTPSFEAADNVVGASLDAAALATPACDGGCNLIAESEYSIELAWEGYEPAVNTTVIGNQLGIDATGTGWAQNGHGISGGAGTTVGGFRAGDGNRINGGGSAISCGGPDLTIVGNQIGVNASGAALFHPASDGITVWDEKVSAPADEALIADNIIGLDGGTGIDERGLGATIVDNVIVGAASGLILSEANAGHGSLVEGNLIEETRYAGMMIGNDFNEVLGNEVLESGFGGIEILGWDDVPVTGNQIGGDSPEDENVISFSGQDAIVFGGAAGGENEVARNRGTANEGLFIRLAPPNWGSLPQNGGVEPPDISSTTVTGIAGSAEPGARIRVFRKEGDEPGEVEGFLGEAVADFGGAWEIGYAPLPGGTFVAATQTNVEGGTSELAIARTPGGTEGTPEGGSTGGSRPSPRPARTPAADTTPPQTKLGKVRFKGRGAVFRFGSSEQGSSFQCRLDAGRFRACGSPKRYRRLTAGRHRFEARAVDVAGNVDSTPVRRSFAVPRGHR